MSQESSNKRVKYVTEQLNRELQVEPICSNFSYIDFENTPTFQPPQTTYSRKEQVVFDGDDINKGNDYRRVRVNGETGRTALDYSHYIINGQKTAGRGFGDHDISQELRYGLDTRQEKKTAASTDLSDFKIGNNFYSKFDRSGNNMPAPEIIHLVEDKNKVIPWVRGGIDTRNLDKYRKN